MSHTVKSTTKPRVSNDALRQRARTLLGRALGFRDCTAPALDALVDAGQLRQLQRGEYAARRGDVHTHAGMLVGGLLESSALRADGHRHLVGLLLPGDFFGLLGLVDGEPHTHDVSAREDAVTLSLPNDRIRPLREREPCLVRAFELQIAHRMRLLMERLNADPAVPLDVRAANMLQILATLYGHAQNNRVVLDVKLSQTDLADWLGLSRQRVNFALKQLEGEALIALGYSEVTITDAAGLAAKARS